MCHVSQPQPAPRGWRAVPGTCTVPAGEFAGQMQALKDAGWYAVTLDQLEAYWTDGAPLGPGKPIVVTFDNGYESQYTNALPTLCQLGGSVSTTSSSPAYRPRKEGWRTLRSAADQRRVGARHGISHADMITLDATQLHYQIATARQILRPALWGRGPLVLPPLRSLRPDRDRSGPCSRLHTGA